MREGETLETQDRESVEAVHATAGGTMPHSCLQKGNSNRQPREEKRGGGEKRLRAAVPRNRSWLQATWKPKTSIWSPEGQEKVQGTWARGRYWPYYSKGFGHKLNGEAANTTGGPVEKIRAWGQKSPKRGKIRPSMRMRQYWHFCL